MSLLGTSPASRLVARMRCAAAPCALAAAFALAVCGAAQAAAVSGVVRNGTTGSPAAGVDVVLIALQGNMESVATTKTDAQGRYSFDHPSIGQQAMLIRAVYRGVNFHQPLPPGSATADVTIYDSTSDPRALQLSSRLVVLQPNGDRLLVGEEYGIRNSSQPPVAYYSPDGSFEFELPEGGELTQVSSWGPSGMPVVQGTINRGERKYAIAYAFQPGDNGVRLSYEIPYASNRATLRFTSAYAVPRMLLVAPPGVQVTGEGLAPAGTEQGFNLYSRDAVAPGQVLEVAVSGTAPPPSAGQQPASGAPGLQTLPNRLSSLQWILIGGLAALFGLGLMFLWRRPVAAVAGAGAEPHGVGSAAPRRSQKVPAAAPPVALPELDREVGQSLDGLKDQLFRLELRRQAGTISEEEYASERRRAEQRLRELVRG